MNNSELKIFSGNDNLGLAEKIAGKIGTNLGKIEIKRFADGEQYVRFLENVRGRDAFLVQGSSKPVSENLMELLIMIDAAKRASAARVTAVMPYFGYARQDRKAASREPITAKLVADLISAAGADRVITLDLHAGQIQGFFNIPVDNLSASLLLMGEIEKELGDYVVIAPDAGSAKGNIGIAKRFGRDYAIINKIRQKHNEAKVMNIIGDVRGKNCVIIDDLIDTAGTICVGADALKEAGAERVLASATHGIFSSPAIERIEKSALEKVIVTDSTSARIQCKKIKTISVANLFAEAIQRSHNNESISCLFE